MIRREDNEPQVLVPAEDLSVEQIKALREKVTREAHQALLRQAGCVGCSHIERYDLTAEQIMFRLKGKVPVFCCELLENKKSEKDE